MKNYFDFTLTGKRLFPLWILYWILVFVPRSAEHIYEEFYKSEHPFAHETLILFFVMLFVGIAAMTLHYYLNKMYIDHTVYHQNSFRFKGTFNGYLWMFIPNFALTLVTLGIYFPWFIKAYTQFFVDNTERKDKRIKFLGNSTDIFLAFMLFFVPVFSTVMYVTLIRAPQTPENSYTYLIQVVQFVFLIPALTLFIKWLINVQYNGYHIYLPTKFWPSFGKIILELFFTVITVGIYFPAMCIKLYEYFISRSVAEKDEIQYSFGFEKNTSKYFLFLWGQIILVIITLGIYSPWAISKIGKLFLSRTYLLMKD